MLVDVLKVKDGKALITWQDGVNKYKVWIPADKLKEGNQVEHPDKGLKYGDNFEHEIKALPNAADIAQALNNLDVWTWDDLRNSPNKVLIALQQTYGNTANQLLSKLQGD